MSITLGRAFNVVFTLLIFILLHEKFYNIDKITGESNLLICFSLIVLGVIYLIIKNNIVISFENLFRGILYFLLVIYTLYLGSFSYFAYFYGILIIIIYIYNKNILIVYDKLFFPGILLSGLIFTIVQKLEDIERVTGFMSTSPTIFSYIILIAAVYLLNDNINSSLGKILFISVISLYIIYSTGSRSTLICLLLFIGYSILKNLYLHYNTYKLIFVFLLFSATITFLIVYGLNFRENGFESTSDRLLMINYFLNELVFNFNSYIIGKGAWYTNLLTPYILGWNVEEFPLHQDIITILVELGYLGTILLVITLTYKNKIHLLTIFLFIIGSFHNIIISPICIVLLVLFNNLIVSKRT